MQVKWKLDQIIFGTMVWVFLSLNAAYFNFSIYSLIRWVLPVMLLFFAFTKKMQVYAPPLLLVLFVFAVLPSLINSVDLQTSVMKAISFVLVVYSVYSYFMDKKAKGEITNPMKIFMVLVIIFQILNIVFVLLGINRASDGRNSGFTTNANTLGVYSNIAIWSAYYFFMKSKGWKHWCFLLVIILSIYTALESGSRSAFLILLISLSIIFFLQVKNSFARSFVVIAVIGGLVLLFSGKLSFLEITALDRLLEDGGTTRGDLWEEGLSVWQRFKLFGCGYKTSEWYNSEAQGLAFHNSYLTLLIEVGLWGTLLIVIGFLMDFIRIIKVIFHKIKNFQFDISFAVFFIVLSLLINSWSESFLFSMGSTEAFVFWMSFMWLSVYTRKEKSYVIEKQLNNRTK